MHRNPLSSFLGATLLACAISISLAAQDRPPARSFRKPATRNSRTPASSGVKGAPTSGTKKVSGKGRRSRRRVRGQRAPTPERIHEIQAALAREGVYAAQSTGKWDAATVEAMKRFQAAHNLNPTGKLDALSLQQLGLGSVTAGRAAPRPPLTSLPASVSRPQ